VTDTPDQTQSPGKKEPRTLRLEIDVRNPDSSVCAGMYAYARISRPSPTMARSVPNNAILFDPIGSRIMAVDFADQIHIRSVESGCDFGTKAKTLSGLDTQDRGVQNQADDLHEGTFVSSTT
jgi:hypothetical protein